MSGDRPPGTSPTVGGYSPEKFSSPVVTDVVSRARLHPLVTAPSGAPVTVVAAAAGWGKTIFAASWLRAGNAGRKGVWVSLEEADDDPHAFWCAVAAGLMPVVPAGAGEALRRVAAGAVAAEELPGAVATALRLAPDPIAVILDNLHGTQEGTIAAARVHLLLGDLGAATPRLFMCAVGSALRCSTPCSPSRPGTSTGRATTSRTLWPPPRPGRCADLSWPRRDRCGPRSNVASRPEPPSAACGRALFK